MRDVLKIVLDYSSPHEEQKRETQEERERREALENYNESTYGERHPIVSSFVRFAAFAVIAALLIWFVPFGCLLATAAMLVSVILERVRYR